MKGEIFWHGRVLKPIAKHKNYICEWKGLKTQFKNLVRFGRNFFFPNRQIFNYKFQQVANNIEGFCSFPTFISSIQPILAESFSGRILTLAISQNPLKKNPAEQMIGGCTNHRTDPRAGNQKDGQGLDEYLRHSLVQPDFGHPYHPSSICHLAKDLDCSHRNGANQICSRTDSGVAF